MSIMDLNKIRARNERRKKTGRDVQVSDGVKFSAASEIDALVDEIEWLRKALSEARNYAA